MLFIASLLNSAILLAQATDSLPKDKIVSINIRGVAIEGSLLSRSAKEKLVIIIAGSGPTDRNGNSIAGVYSNAYKMLAQELSKNNISSFRYDKRAIGKSVVKNFKEKDLSFDDYINDVVAIYQYMKDSLGFKKIYFAGHSEGSLVGMVAAEKTNPQGYISIAGAGRPIDKVIVEHFPSIKVLPSLETYGDDARTQRVIGNVFQNNSDIVGFYVISSEARIPIEIVSRQSAIKDLIRIAHERTPFTEKALRLGDLDAVIAQDPGHVVRSAIRILRARCDQREPLASQENIRIEIFLKENI